MRVMHVRAPLERREVPRCAAHFSRERWGLQPVVVHMNFSRPGLPERLHRRCSSDDDEALRRMSDI